MMVGDVDDIVNDLKNACREGGGDFRQKFTRHGSSLNICETDHGELIHSDQFVVEVRGDGKMPRGEIRDTVGVTYQDEHNRITAIGTQGSVSIHNDKDGDDGNGGGY